MEDQLDWEFDMIDIMRNPNSSNISNWSLMDKVRSSVLEKQSWIDFDLVLTNTLSLNTLQKDGWDFDNGDNPFDDMKKMRSL